MFFFIVLQTKMICAFMYLIDFTYDSIIFYFTINLECFCDPLLGGVVFLFVFKNTI